MKLNLITFLYIFRIGCDIMERGNKKQKYRALEGNLVK